MNPDCLRIGIIGIDLCGVGVGADYLAAYHKRGGPLERGIRPYSLDELIGRGSELRIAAARKASNARWGKRDTTDTEQGGD